MSNLSTKILNPILKLDLGCGIRNRKQPAEEWIHIDIQEIEGIDIIRDFKELPFPDNSISEINAADVIEHIPATEVENVLKEWFRTLKSGGKITIATPNLHATMLRYAWGELKFKDAYGALYGSNENPYQHHYQTFTIETLEILLFKAGFCDMDFSESPGSEDKNLAWWIVVTAIKK